jgi:hypothetical protein
VLPVAQRKEPECATTNRHDLATIMQSWHDTRHALHCVMPRNENWPKEASYCGVMMMDDGLNLEVPIGDEPLQAVFALLVSSTQARTASHWRSACLTLILNVAWEAGV